VPADLHDAPPVPPETDPPGSLRENLREARTLLEQAGWRVGDDGQLRNARGEGFVFEVLSYSPSLERIATPWVRNLAKLGISVSLRVADPALYQRRLDAFDFDVTTHVFPMSQTPGNELLDMFASESAGRDGSSNLPGIRDPLVDALIERLLRAESREQLVVATRVLDRALRRGWYVVPHFHLATHRIAHAKWLRYWKPLPKYFGADSWTTRTWWSER
jgi:microcin C transport system substrate-binding protein